MMAFDTGPNGGPIGRFEAKRSYLIKPVSNEFYTMNGPI